MYPGVSVVMLSHACAAASQSARARPAASADSSSRAVASAEPGGAAQAASERSRIWQWWLVSMPAVAVCRDDSEVMAGDQAACAAGRRGGRRGPSRPAVISLDRGGGETPPPG